MKYYTESEKKRLSKAYDAAYDARDIIGPKAGMFMDSLEKDAKKRGYMYKLSYKTQKFKLKKEQ